MPAVGRSFSSLPSGWAVLVAAVVAVVGPRLAGGERPAATHAIAHVWANEGGDKVCREELRAASGEQTTCSAWDGATLRLDAARNETVSLQLVLEAPEQDAELVSVELSPLEGPGGARLATRSASGEGVFDYRSRPIELFFVRYLPIRGLSVLAYDHYDERHVPERFRRPHDANGYVRGLFRKPGWEDRPDHDRSYPDIAAPLEWHTPFRIERATSQAIWVDVWVPPATEPGVYRGEAIVREAGDAVWRAPLELRVRSFMLPELPTGRPALYVSAANINRRYLGEKYPLDSPDPEVRARSKRLVDRHFQLAHRHRVALFHEHESIERCEWLWADRLSGDLFRPDRGYEGPGVGVGNNLFVIGAYGSWPWKEGDRDAMWRATDQWAAWIESLRLRTPTDVVLYLADESDDYEPIERWSRWAAENPGPGSRVKPLATIPAPKAREHTPHLAIAASTLAVGPEEPWRTASAWFRDTPGKQFWLYNAARPASGCFVTEDDGVALRTLGWCQFKAGAQRWFCWEGSYYDNYQGGAGETNVFRSAHTFGGSGREDASLGLTGWNYNNGDGVLFYPGVDTRYPDDSYGFEGPIASLRLKHWRRGVQDLEYLTLASQIDEDEVGRIVRSVAWSVLWEGGIDDPSDPTYRRSDIGWTTDPDAWERARRALADLVERAGP